MAFIQHLVKSLRSGRTITLPDDYENAFFILMPMVIANQHSSVAQLLQASSFDVNFTCGHSQRGLLQIASNCGATDCLSILLRRGAKVNAQDISGCTSLHLAARNGHRNCLLKLLEHNADVNIRNNEGLTMLHWLAVNGRTELLNDTLPHITSIDIEDSQGQTALHVACQNGHISTIVCLLNYGSNINHRDHHGSTPLHFACSHGQRDSVKLLLQRKAEFVVNNKKITPLDLCIQGGYSETCETLLHTYPCLFDQVVQNVTQLHVQESKLLKVLSYLTCTNKTYEDTVLSVFAEMASHIGQQLLSPSSNLEYQTSCLLRCMRLLYRLCKSEQSHSNPSRNSSALKPLEVLWNSLEEWLLLFKSEILNLSQDDDPANQKIPVDTLAMEGQTTNQSAESCIEKNSPSEAVPTTIEDQQKPVESVHMSMPLQNGVPEDSSSLPNETVKLSVASTQFGIRETSADGATDKNMLLTMAPRIMVIIESFYMYCSCQSPPKTTPPRFIDFVNRHEDVLKFLVENDPKKIFDSFHFLFDCPELMSRFLDIIHAQPFESRQSWFYENLHLWNTPKEENDEGTVYDPSSREDLLVVNRENCFHSSCEQFSRKTPERLMKGISVKFHGEEGMGHGVLKEWFDVLSKEILNPDYALFTQSADGSTFQPNSNSAVNPDHLNYFRFAGQVMGLALYHQQLLGVYFTRSFYKHILGIPVSYTDVASVDPEYSRNLQWILDHDIADLGLDLTFAVETDVFGLMQEVELKPGGRDMSVTELNKHEYVQLVAELRMTKAIEQQVKSFLAGFNTFIPQSLMQMFDADELRLLLSGLPDIDVADWEDNTEYNGYAADDDQIVWFWECVRDLDVPSRILLLQFVTGCSFIPHGGFAALSGGGSRQKFTILRCEYHPMILPSASTCINMLKLPEYTSKDELRDRILVAIRFGSQGYGIV